MRIDPKHERAIFNLGALYAARGDYPRAVPLLEKAAGTPACNADMRASGDRALLLTLVNAYVHVERKKEALDLSHCLEETSADDPRALFTLALSLAEAHEYAEAVRLFQRTNELRPQTYEVLYNLGLALYNLDRLDEAREALTSAALLTPAEADPFYRLGLVASAQGDTKTALMHWAKALDLRLGVSGSQLHDRRRVVEESFAGEVDSVLRTCTGPE